MMNEDKHYIVHWEIDIWAKNEKDAAYQALEIQRDPNSTAMVFDVVDAARGSGRNIDIGYNTSRPIQFKPRLFAKPRKKTIKRKAKR